MIDAIYLWLTTQFPTYNFVKQSLKKTDPQSYVLIIDTGGTSQAWPNNNVLYKIQIITQSVTDARSREMMLDIFDFIGERYGEILSDGNSDIRIAKIRAIDRPFPLGNDGEGFQYSLNYEFLTL